MSSPVRFLSPPEADLFSALLTPLGAFLLPQMRPEKSPAFGFSAFDLMQLSRTVLHSLNRIDEWPGWRKCRPTFLWRMGKAGNGRQL